MHLTFMSVRRSQRRLASPLALIARLISADGGGGVGYPLFSQVRR